MDVEAPGVQVGTTIAFISAKALIIDRVYAVAATSNNQSMEVTDCDLIYLFLIELLQPPNRFPMCVLIGVANS